MNKRTLKCFYDLAISPCSYDFFAFLISAELHRIRNNFDDLSVIFLPGPNLGYRNDNLRSFEQNDNFFKNVLLNGPLLYNSCKSIIWLSNRIDALDHLGSTRNIFPRGYSLENTKTDYVYQGIVTSYFRGDKPVFFQAPNYSKDLAKNLLMQTANKKKFITLTTRELNRDDPGTRRVDLEFWENFFGEVDKSKFQPIIIRDTSKALSSRPLFKDVPEIPEASIHLHLRYAIYQASFLNIFKPNGPSMLSLYGTAPTLFFFKPNDHQCSISANWYKNNYGMNAGSQFPLTTKNKKIVWNEENSYSLDSFLSYIEKSEENFQRELHPITDRKTLIYTTKIALSHTIENLKYGVLDEDIKVLQVYSNFLERKFISGPKPVELIKENENKNLLKRGTLNQILQLDQLTKSALVQRPLIYQT